METGTIIAIIFFSGFIIGGVCSVIAEARGVNRLGWFFLGFLLNFTAIPFAAIALPNQAKLDEKGIEEGTHKNCPECAEIVKVEAVKCRYCHSTLEVEEQQQENNDSKTEDSTPA